MPFLAVNFPPSRLIMGDVGAVPLGFLAAAFGCALVAGGHWPAWFPALVFLPFIADATTTLARRALRGERIWEAHRSHYYQRLHRLGAGHRGTLAIYGAWMAGCGITRARLPAVGKGAGLAGAGRLVRRRQRRFSRRLIIIGGSDPTPFDEKAFQLAGLAGLCP